MSVRRISPRVAAVMVALAVLAAGCRTSTETTADNPGGTTPAPSAAADPDGEGDGAPEGSFNDPSAGPDRAADEPRIVPPLELPSSAPGSDAAAAALLDELERFITPEQLAAGVPWPDLRNPDPVASYQSDAAFQNWMSAQNPTPSLVEAYTAPGSPERGFDLELFGFLNGLDLRAGPADPPYSMRVVELVHPAATGITDALLEQVPAGSAAVVYFDSVGASDTFTADGQYYSSDSGWVDIGPWVAIMAPTDVGWQVWWDELTDPPPPGSRQQGGTPQEQEPRRDV